MNSSSSGDDDYDSDDIQQNGGHVDILDPSTSGAAPRYKIDPRVLGAVEIPAVVENVDRAVKAFGRVPNLQHVSLCSQLLPTNKSGSNESTGHGCRQELDSLLLNPGEPVLQTNHVS